MQSSAYEFRETPSGGRGSLPLFNFSGFRCSPRKAKELVVGGTGVGVCESHAARSSVRPQRSLGYSKWVKVRKKSGSTSVRPTGYLESWHYNCSIDPLKSRIDQLKLSRSHNQLLVDMDYDIQISKQLELYVCKSWWFDCMNDTAHLAVAVIGAVISENFLHLLNICWAASFGSGKTNYPVSM